MTLTYHEVMTLESIADDLTAVSKWIENCAKHRATQQLDNAVHTAMSRRLQRTAAELLAMREAGTV